MPNFGPLFKSHLAASKNRKSKSKRSGTKKLKKDVAELKRITRAERGILTEQISTGITSSWNNVKNLYTLAQGDLIDSREGDNIIATTVQFTGNFVKADDTNCLRLIVVQFESAADSSIANVLLNDISLVLQPYKAYNSPYRVDGDCKYRILADKKYKLNQDEVMKDIAFKVKIPKSKSTMKYTSSGSAIPQTNLISVLAVSDSLAVSDPVLNLSMRQRYHK